ncbi:MAG: hypothetical protein R3F59_27585 [Myxococcota bacterium]
MAEPDPRPDPAPEPASGPSPRSLAADGRLRDHLAHHLDLVEPGLALYVDPDGRPGLDYDTPVGPASIVALDAHDRLVLIEVVTDDAADAGLARLLRCRGWVRQHLAGGAEVRSVLVVERVTEALRYLLAEVRNVELFSWTVAVAVHRTPV